MADMVESNDETILQKLPALPEGKSRHFFVSYSCEEREKVIEFIDELERRFPIKCYYSDRDFQAGKDIAVNIKEGMALSVKVLLFVSPSFLQSGWCKYETDAAFVTSMGCGYSCIVPVLLEECEIPPTLVTLTYIDGTIPGVDIPAKIAASLLRPDTDDGMLGLNMKSWNKIYENGYSDTIAADREPLLFIRPAKYKFTLQQNTIDRLELNKVKVPYTLLTKAIEMINKEPAVFLFDWFHRKKNAFRIIPFAFVLMIFLGGLVINSLKLAYFTRSTDYDKKAMNDSSGFLMAVLSLLFITIIIATIWILPRFGPNKRHEYAIQSRLWKVVGKECIENNILLLYSSKKKKQPTLFVMRYNVTRCKEYFVGILKSKNLPHANEMTPEEHADIIFDWYLARITITLADDFDSQPDAPSNRHNVKGGKMCLCQQLEQELI